MTAPNEKDGQAPIALLSAPLTAFQAGFDYAFGFQIKLMLSLFGLDANKRD